MDMSDRVVGKTFIDDHQITTVYIEHFISDYFKEVPHWETMIFPTRNYRVDYNKIYCKRYLTLKQAIKGHKEAVIYQMNLTHVRKSNGYLEWDYDEE